MKEKFLKVARQSHFFDKHRFVLVAVSAGKDSLALFHLLYDIQDELGITLGIAHVNHGQRSISEEEEEYLMQLAQKLAVPFYTDKFTGIFTEANARNFRYTFFEQIMREEGYTALVTAHHRDDQAETVLMRIIRGGRVANLQGIQAVQPFGIGELIRPLLSFSKVELPDVFHFEDDSNNQPIYFRNRIRNTYLPLLEQENPQIKQSLQALGQEMSILQSALVELTKTIPMEDTQIFQSQVDSVQQILLQQYLERFPDLQLKKAQFQQVLSMLRSSKSYSIKLKSKYAFFKDNQTFSIHTFSPQMDDRMPSVFIEYGQSICIGNNLYSFGNPIEDANQELTVEKDKPILLRTRKTGDILLINGHHKKLRRYFIDKKIPREERERSCIIEQSGKILGIAEIVASDLSKIDKNDIMKATLYIKKIKVKTDHVGK